MKKTVQNVNLRRCKHTKSVNYWRVGCRSSVMIILRKSQGSNEVDIYKTSIQSQFLRSMHIVFASVLRSNMEPQRAKEHLNTCALLTFETVNVEIRILRAKNVHHAVVVSKWTIVLIQHFLDTNS